MSENHYRFTLVSFVCVALVTVIMLSAVTKHITFKQLDIETTLIEGDPPPAVLEPELTGAPVWNPFFSEKEQLLPTAYALFAFLLTSVWLLSTEKGRQMFTACLIILTLIAIVVYSAPEEEEIIPLDEGTLFEYVVEDVVPVRADWINEWLTWGVAVLIALIVLGAFYWVWKRWFSPPQKANDEIATVAYIALAELDAGASLEDVIRWSYEAMQTAVRNRIRLSRRVGMTVREFEERLVEGGLPVNAVGNLTRLFEQVRYGAYVATARDEHIARSALESIVTVCEARFHNQIQLKL